MSLFLYFLIVCGDKSPFCGTLCFGLWLKTSMDFKAPSPVLNVAGASLFSRVNSNCPGRGANHEPLTC